MAELPGKKRTLTRDNSLLREFNNNSTDPNLLVLYHHLRDKAFDCFNSIEYTEQMLRYATKNIKVVEVVSRKLNDSNYFLVCLRNSEDETANPLW